MKGVAIPMKTKHLMQKLTCAVLVPSILLMSACSAKQQPEESTNGMAQPPAIEQQNAKTYAPYTGKTRKSETVYVTMDAKGNASKKIVTDWLHTEQAGVQVTDQSDLEGIQNIKGDTKPVQNGNQITWNLDSTDLYYKGESNKALPVDISIRYYLDGAEIEPQALAGKSGKVKMEIQMKNTEPHTVMVNGRETVIYTPVAALGGMLLPEEKFQNIKMENGATLGDGSKQLAVFIALPGLHDSLDLASMPLEELRNLSFPETFTLTADVKDFELDNMYFAMTTDIPALDLSKASGQLSEIKKSLYALNDMQNAVEQLDPDHVLRSLLTDGGNLQELRSLMEELTSIYEKDKALLDLLPQYFTKENLTLVSKLAKDADAAELAQLLGDKKLLSSANQLLDSSLMQNIQKLLIDVVALQSIDLKPLDQILSAAGNLDSLSGVLDSSSGLLGKLASSEEELQTLTELMGSSTDAIKLLKEVSSLLDSLKKQGITLTEDDIRVMVDALVDKKAMEIAAEKTGVSAKRVQAILDASANDLIAANGAIAKGNRQTVQDCIEIAARNDQTAAKLKDTLLPKVEKGSVGVLLASPTRLIVTTVQKTIRKELAQKDEIADSVTKQLSALLKEAEALGTKVEQIGPDRMESLLTFATGVLPDLQTLAGELAKNKDQLASLNDLLSNKSAMQYLQKTAKQLMQMKQDFEANAGQLTLLAQVMQAASNPHLKAFAKMLPTLAQDLKDAAPILESLSGDLNDPAVRASLDNMPETIAALMRIQADLSSGSEIMKALQNAAQPETLSTASGIVKTLDQIEQQGLLSKYTDAADAAASLLGRVQAWLNLSKEYGLYTQAADGMDTDVKFILKTDSIKAEPQQPAQAQPQEEAGVAAWFKGLFDRKG